MMYHSKIFLPGKHFLYNLGFALSNDLQKYEEQIIGPCFVSLVSSPIIFFMSSVIFHLPVRFTSGGCCENLSKVTWWGKSMSASLWRDLTLTKLGIKQSFIRSKGWFCSALFSPYQQLHICRHCVQSQQHRETAQQRLFNQRNIYKCTKLQHILNMGGVVLEIN